MRRPFPRRKRELTFLRGNLIIGSAGSETTNGHSSRCKMHKSNFRESVGRSVGREDKKSFDSLWKTSLPPQNCSKKRGERRKEGRKEADSNSLSLQKEEGEDDFLLSFFLSFRPRCQMAPRQFKAGMEEGEEGDRQINLRCGGFCSVSTPPSLLSPSSESPPALLWRECGVRSGPAAQPLAWVCQI